MSAMFGQSYRPCDDDVSMSRNHVTVDYMFIGQDFAQANSDTEVRRPEQELPACPLSLAALRSRLSELRSGWPPGVGSQPQPQVQASPKRRAMPAWRGRKGLCGCLQDDEPPEITYCVVGHAGALSLQALTPTQPMPAQEELDAMFAELVEELDLSATNKAAMLDLPPQKKWQIYCSRKPAGCDVTDGGDVIAVGGAPPPEHYIDKLQAIASRFASTPTVADDSPLTVDPDVTAATTSLLDALRTALRTSTNSFVLRFMQLQGLHALLQLLQAMDYATAQSSVHTSLIGCIKALMNNSTGRAHVLAHPTGIDTIAQSLSADNIKTKVSALEILGAVCLVPGGHRKVLRAMHHYQKYASERTRFQGIVNDLDRSMGVYRDEVNLKTAIMSFINAVLNYGPGKENLEFRLHLRYEFLMLGIQPIIDKLRSHENETLDRHLDFFEMVRNEDEKELARKFEKEHVDTKSATAMFDLLRRKLSHTAAYPHLLSLLEHFILLPLDYGSHPQHWLLFDRVVQQIVLQTERPAAPDGSATPKNCVGDRDPDVAPLQIDVGAIVQLLVKEEELVAARTRADDLEKDNNDMAAKLAKKEQDLDLRMQEKEDLETCLSRMRERLDKESTAHAQASQRAVEAEHRASELMHQVAGERQERVRLERMVNEGCIPDDAKVSSLKSNLDSFIPAPPKLSTPPAPPPMCPAPPCPPPPGPPPPPAAPACPQAPAVPKQDSAPKKNVPQSANPLKSFNWCKLPEAKVVGTVWSELDDSKWYNNIELESIDKLFSAYQKNGVANDGSIEDLRLIGKNRTKILSVIDGRRAQNCTILLSKLKMSDEDISKAILSMDSGEQLPIDMIEQLLKFTPSAEETAILDEHSEDIDSLARADRFLYEISKIPHYEQRLRSLHYKKRFQVTLGELTPRINNVMEASREVARSRRLRRLLELVLALGNYMNRGARGNASGFRLGSLNRLGDTKSSAAKGTTLLHFLVQILEKKFKDILKLEEDIPHVRDASKVSLKEMEKDVTFLRNGLAEVSRELDFHRATPGAPSDRFLPVMKEFHGVASSKFSELEDKFQDMKTRFDRAVRLFGEDGSLVQPDEFFGIFDAFLTAYTEALNDNENLRRRQEEDEKRAMQEAELKKRTMERKSSREGILSSMSKTLGFKGEHKDTSGTKNEFDDLISALRTGDVFGEDMAKFKRSRKSRIPSAGTSPPRRSSVHRDDSRERSVISTRRQ